MTPPWTEETCKTDTASGKNPKWNKKKNNMMRFPYNLSVQNQISLKDIKVTIEVWVEVKKGPDIFVGRGKKK